MLRSKVTLLFLAFAVAIFAVAGMAMAQTTDTSGSTAAAPTIQSDKEDYPPGGLVTLTGSGWQSGETVNIKVNDTYGASWSRNVDVTADASGNITDSFNLPDWFVSDYNVTATGTQSGTVTTTFTDSQPEPLAGVSVASPTSVTVTQGTAAPYGNVSVDMVGNSSNCTVTLVTSTQSGDTGLPAGASASFGNSPVTTNADFTSSLSVSTTGVNPGTYTFHVNAQKGANCQGSSAAVISTQQLTLKVNSATQNTNTAVASDNNPSTYGDPVKFTATVTGTSTDPSGVGTVAFKDAGNTISGCSAVPLTGNKADCTTSALNAGSHSITAVYSGGTGYNGSTSSALTQNVDKATLTVTANDESREYGEANPNFTGTLTGVKNNDPVTASYTSAATPSSDVGSYPIVASVNATAAVLANYEVSATDGTLTVTKAPLTIKANDESREYGETNPTFSGSIVSGLKNGDALSVTASSSATAASDVGTYDIVPELSGAKASNYDVTAQNGTLTVTPAPLSAEANNASRKYGEANPTFTGTLTGVKNGDAITASYSSAATQASDWGTYSIVTSLNDPNSKLANYQTPVLTNGTLTVTKAPLTIKADDASRFFGDPNPAFTGSIVNAASTVKNNDALTVSASSVATQSSPVGTYAIVPVLNGAKATNYEVTAQNGTLTIKAWTTKGFYPPVDMGGVVNTVKGGSTVPLKFELFSGATELTDTSAIKSLTATKSTCAPGAAEDAIEVTATGGTSLRYDSTGGQFIYNWKTPTGAGCYTVTMTANDGSKITAYFKSLK
jgi:HSP20 family molecular chaperone IbpA